MVENHCRLCLKNSAKETYFECINQFLKIGEENVEYKDIIEELFGIKIINNDPNTKICKSCKNSVEKFYKLKRTTDSEKKATVDAGTDFHISSVLGIVYTYLQKHLNYGILIHEYKDQLILKPRKVYKCEKCLKGFKTAVKCNEHAVKCSKTVPNVNQKNFSHMVFKCNKDGSFHSDFKTDTSESSDCSDSEVGNNLFKLEMGNMLRKIDVEDEENSETEYLVEIQDEDPEESDSDSNQNQLVPEVKIPEPENSITKIADRKSKDLKEIVNKKSANKQPITKSSSINLSCLTCNQKFTSKWSLDFHTDSQHSKEPLFTETEIKSWEIGCLKNKVIYECPICLYKCNKKNNLVRHVWRHSYQTNCQTKKKLSAGTIRPKTEQNDSSGKNPDMSMETTLRNYNAKIKLNSPLRAIKQEPNTSRQIKTPKKAINALGRALQSIEKSLASPGTSAKSSPKKTLNSLAKTLNTLKESLNSSSNAPPETNERVKLWKPKELYKFICSHCQKKFSEKHIRDFHETMFHSDNPITDQEVASCTSMKVVNGVTKKIFSCKSCQHETDKSTSFKMHLWRHRNVNRTLIKKNLEESKDVKNLKIVMKNPLYSCHICNKEIYTEISYLYHYFQSHTDGKFSAKQIESFKQNDVFKCFKDDCSYTTQRGSFFRIHMFRHLSKKFKQSLEGTEADPAKRFIGNKDEIPSSASTNRKRKMNES